MTTTCDICGKSAAPYDRICRVCLEALLMDPESDDHDDAELVYSISLALSDSPLCETRGLEGIMATMPQLGPDIYHVRQGGVIVADATRSGDGNWRVEFRGGLTLAPGYIIV